MTLGPRYLSASPPAPAQSAVRDGKACPGWPSSCRIEIFQRFIAHAPSRAARGFWTIRGDDPNRTLHGALAGDHAGVEYVQRPDRNAFAQARDLSNSDSHRFHARTLDGETGRCTSSI